MEESLCRHGDGHHQILSGEATIPMEGRSPPGPLHRSHHPNVSTATMRSPLEESLCWHGDGHHQIPSREATISIGKWPPPALLWRNHHPDRGMATTNPLWRSHHPDVGTSASPQGSWGWRRFPWRCCGVAICDRPLLSLPVLSKKNKKGVACMGRLASPSPGYGFLLFLAGVAADSSACPDLASFFLLFFFFLEGFHPDPSAETPSLAVGDQFWSYFFLFWLPKTPMRWDIDGSEPQ